MSRGRCAECPWDIDTKNNATIREFAMRRGMVHNCHMLAPENGVKMWDTDSGCECIGASENIGNMGDKTDE